MYIFKMLESGIDINLIAGNMLYHNVILVLDN